MKRFRTTRQPADLSRGEIAEFEAMSREFDDPAAIKRSRPLTPTEHKAYEKAIGRPRVGQGAAKIAISVERSLLRDVDAEAQRLGISRSELIARGLRTQLGNGARGVNRRRRAAVNT